MSLCNANPKEARNEIEAGMSKLSRRAFHAQHMHAQLMLTATDLYEGSGTAATARIEQVWPAFECSRLSAHQGMRIWMSQLRGCAALATGDISRAMRVSRQLEREDNAVSRALAAMLRAGASTGNAAVAAWRRAAQLATDAELPLHSACAALHADDAPRGEAWLRAAGVQDHIALARVYASRIG